jgi:anthranilate/para-aminobenzoate synthase component I
MKVESYETVHQLVTTVRGELFDHVDNIQAVKACFPPGSMTGAPKLRSVQLLDSLENHVKRGIYSGCLGYIGFSAVAAPVSDPRQVIQDNTEVGQQREARSAVDLSVVIRTAVLSVSPVAATSAAADIDGINISTAGKFPISFCFVRFLWFIKDGTNYGEQMYRSFGRCWGCANYSI